MVRLEGLGKLKQSSDLIGIRDSYLPGCSIAPQPVMLPRVLEYIEKLQIRHRQKIGTRHVSRKIQIKDHYNGHQLHRMAWIRQATEVTELLQR
jgi:hypothetical protein